MSQGSEVSRGISAGDILQVIHDFNARGADELTLRRGDKVELIQLDDGFGDGWYLGKHTTENRSGLFPGVYTTLSPRDNFHKNNNSSVSSTISTKGNRLSSEFKLRENGSVSPVSNDETTPLASRHASSADMEPPAETEMNLENGVASRSATSLQSTAVASPLTTSPLSPGVQRTISETLGNDLNGEDSPVLNETLSVIEEHITNFSTPRHSVVAPEPAGGNDSSSDYSSYTGNRLSYIRGAETDEEEEEKAFGEEEVRNWDSKQTARYLLEIGVDSKHCDIFEEQEISGDVLLEMDQEFIYMKDFDFGVMGRRLKTWHKIRAFQDGVKAISHARQESIHSEDFNLTQGMPVTSSFLPRIPSISETHDRTPRLSRDSSYQSPSLSPDDRRSRPSADYIRQANHHNRHSMENTFTLPLQDATPPSATSRGLHLSPHQQKSSFDRNWTMSSPPNNFKKRPETSVGAAGELSHHHRFGSVVTDGSGAQIDPIELDRGYFSGGEVDTRRTRKTLRKRGSANRSFSHSRQSSVVEDPRSLRMSLKKHARFGSTGSMKDLKSRDLNKKPAGLFEDQSHSPTVTNLEPLTGSSSGFLSTLVSPYRTSGEGSGHSSPLPASPLKTVAPKVRRAMGLRAISDGVAGSERSQVPSPSSLQNKDSPRSPTQTGSSTPSGTSKSFEIESNGSLRMADGLTLMNPPKGAAHRAKSKKETSAYRRGLEKKSPKEQIIDCDYYGWMKKKSSNLMTTWKPRLFVLRGLRLSYYYSENDTEERGLIDISSHRVFRADKDPVTSLHATITGAKVNPTSPTNSSSLSAEPRQSDATLEVSKKRKSSETPFIFKLVPPKAGLSRAVQFTKPAVHFFQVDSIQEGRLWMAALMKATIERDLNLPVRTTNKQKTVSLKKALAASQSKINPPKSEEPSNKEEENKANTSEQNSEASATNSNSISSQDFEKLEKLGELGELDPDSFVLFPDSPAPGRSLST